MWLTHLFFEPGTQSSKILFLGSSPLVGKDREVNTVMGRVLCRRQSGCETESCPLGESLLLSWTCGLRLKSQRGQPPEGHRGKLQEVMGRAEGLGRKGDVSTGDGLAGGCVCWWRKGREGWLLGFKTMLLSTAGHR